MSVEHPTERELDRLARVRLSCVVEPLDRTLTPVLHGRPAQEAWEMVSDPGDARFARARARVESLDLDAVATLMRVHDIRVVTPGDDEWPELLDDLAVPPWCLWVRGQGHLRDLTRHAVAVVGARAATPYGTSVARELAGDLALRKWTVVSGAAFGIDAAAHQGALAARRPTVAVLACGVDRAYPQAHREMLDTIRDAGVVVSEIPPGSTPTKYRFLSRNRLIAAMSAGTVVVEAGLRSGSLNTAHHAVDLGRPVGAYPGPVTSSTSAGTNELIRQGAALVTDAAEVLDLVSPIGDHVAEAQQAPDHGLDVVSEVAKRTHEGLPATAAVGVDHLVREAGLTAGEVLAGLGELASAGLVEQTEEGWCRR